MYTQCPECLTVYEIDEDALQASLGIVQCGRCSKRFDALRTLSDSLPLAPLTPLPEQDPTARAPTLTEAVPPAAYESAVRKRRAHEAPGKAGAAQHELELAPSVPAVPDDDNETQRANADDWFADLETELGAAAAVESSDTALPAGDEDGTWTVEAPDGTSGNAAGVEPAPAAVAAGQAPEILSEARASAADEWDPRLADLAPIQPPAPDAFDPEPEPDPRTMPAEIDAPGVVSPRLLEGDVFAAEIAPPAGDDVVVSDDTETDAPAEVVEPDADTGADAPAEPESSEAEATATATDPAAPVYVRPRRHRVAVAGMAWGGACLLLALLLAVQLGWANRGELVRDPATRAWTERLCRNLPCRLPPIKDVAQLELVSRDVRPDPNASGALTITATVRNDASFRQPWPVVTVELTDVDNHVVAMRRFRPAEYMPDPARRAAGIAPGATAALAFEVADPGKNASGFRFGFE